MFTKNVVMKTHTNIYTNIYIYIFEKLLECGL